MTRWQDRFMLIPAVFVIVRNQKGEVLLLKRQNTGYMDSWYSMPAGHVDGGEPAIVAACREAKEEVGLDLKPEDLRLVHTVHELADGHERLNLAFEVLQYEGEPQNTEPHKCAELHWVALDALPEHTVPSLRAILQHIAAGEPYSSYNFELEKS